MSEAFEMLNSTETISVHLDPAVAGHHLFEDMFNSLASGILLVDKYLYILRVGAGLCALLGYEQSELIGKSIRQIVSPEDWEQAEVRMQVLALHEKQNFKFERRYMHKDGSRIWVVVSVSALQRAQERGQPCYVVQVTSIDKQKLAERSADDASTRWDFALESAGQGAWDCDVATDTWTYSPTWRHMRGIGVDEELKLDDEHWLKEIHPDDQALVLEKMADRFKPSMDEVSYEYRQLHRDGHWMWILARGRVLERDELGMPLRIIGTDTDVTELRNREQELAAVYHRLKLSLSTSQVGVWKYDISSARTFWDRRCCEMFDIEWQDGEIPMGTWENLVHPDDFQKANQICLDGIAQRKNYSLDYRIILASGKIKYIRCRAAFQSNELDHNSVTGVMWDVTEDIERAEAFRSAKMLAENRSRDLEVARSRLEYASLHDSLTGLPNRRHLDNLLGKFQTGSKQGHSLTLLHIDLDRFKQINDTKGHAAGDAVLVQTAVLLRTHFRTSDLVARIGGDEFVVVLSPSPKRRVLQAMVDRVLQISSQPIEWRGFECRCGVSIGVAESAGDVDPRQLLINADIALYRAKRMGRNCAVHFTGSLQAEVIANKQCADDMLNALDRTEFIPYYQPIFDAQSRDVVGIEALARWNHPHRGLLTPDKFLNVASELNAMNSIDRTILEQALEHLKIWDQAGIGIPKISVNVSARRLSNSALLDSLRLLNIEPGRVSFELLESIFLDDSDDLNEANIVALKKLGIGIDIDDFGTGHASIISLLRLNPRVMKIDRQLTLNIVDSQAQRRLVGSLIEIGKSQNIKVCAEGVETATHAQILTDLGVDYLQGYHFARPMPFCEVAPFVKAGSWRKADISLSHDHVTGKSLTDFLAKQDVSKAS